jgi:transcriptional regulator with XRE-family HTH domain
MSSNFKENLREELDFQNLTVKELSVKTKIPVATLDCYLRTQATEPSAENAVRIAQALQVSVEYLVIGEKSYQPQKALSREAKELIRWIENLNSERCKAVLNLIKIFKDTTSIQT